MSISKLTRAIASRVQLLGGGGIDSKRPAAWCEYGFPETLGFSDFFRAYKRTDLAHGAVKQTVEKCWETNPWVIEGDETKNKTAVTPTEAAWARLFKDLQFWHHLAEADTRRLVGRYSGLLLFFEDGRDWRHPVRGTARLARIEPVWADRFKPETWHTDTDDAATYGTPKTYTYTEPGFGGRAANSRTIHADRLILLGTLDPRETAFLEPGFNQLVNLEKIAGGSGESILKNAARQLAVEFDLEADLQAVAQERGITPEQLQEEMDQRARDMGSLVDAVMVVQGGQVKPLSVTPIDPQNAFNVAASAFAASVSMPVKVLIGMQTGERASTEDQKAWNATCQSRRVTRLSRDILHVLNHLRRVRVLSFDGEISVMWDDLRRASRTERLTDAKTMAETNVLGVTTGQPYYSDEEIREVGGFDGNAE